MYLRRKFNVAGKLSTPELLTETIVPHADVIALVSNLRKLGLKLAILSNTIEPHAKALRALGLYDGFDKVFLSHEVGMHKPDADI